MSIKVNPAWFDGIKFLGGGRDKKFIKYSKTLDQKHKEFGQRITEIRNRKKLPLEEQRYAKYKDVMKWLLKAADYKNSWKCTKLSENIRTLKNGKRLKEYKYRCDRYEKEYTFYSDKSDDADKLPNLPGNQGDQGCIRCKMILGELWLCDLLDKTSRKYIYKKKLGNKEFSFYILVGKGAVVEHYSRKHYIQSPELAKTVQEDKEKAEICKKLDIPYVIVPYGHEYGIAYGPPENRTKFSLNKVLESYGDVTEKCLSFIQNF